MDIISFILFYDYYREIENVIFKELWFPKHIEKN